jgi:membrane protein GlpM
MGIASRTAIGAFLVLLLQVAASSRYYLLAGLLPLFPTFTLISVYVIGTTRSTGDLQNTLLFGMLSLIPFFIFQLTAYIGVCFLPLSAAMFLGIAAWLIGAGAIFIGWNILL